MSSQNLDNINFFDEGVGFSLSSPDTIKAWVFKVIQKQGFTLVTLNYIFCDDEYLRNINVEYLDHNTYTDIITFDHSEEEGKLESDIYISIERVKENAAKFGNPFDDELHRVLIHGVLHLMGQEDKTEEDKQEMRKREEACLSLRAY